MASFVSPRRKGFSLWSAVLVLNTILLAFAVFFVTQAVKQREAHVTKLNRMILAEQQAVRVLDAEWAYLTRPQRLEELVAMRDGTNMAPVVNVIEPASGHVEALKEEPKMPVIAKAAAAKEPVTKNIKTMPVKKAVIKAMPVKAATAEIIWSPKKNKPIAIPTRMAQTPKHVGVARPILE